MKKSDFGICDFIHLKSLNDAGYKVSPTDYLYLDQVKNLQSDPERGHWCTMSNEKMRSKLMLTDSGLRSMQRRLKKQGLLETQSGNKTGKRVTSAFLNCTTQSPSESDDRQKVTDSPSKSDDQVRQKVTDSPSKSDDERKESKSKSKVKEKEVVLPFKTELFLDSWNLWKDYKKEQYKFTYKPIAEQSALTRLFNDSGKNEAQAIKMIENAIAHSWKGIYKINETKSNTQSTYQSRNKQMVMTDWSKYESK